MGMKETLIVHTMRGDIEIEYDPNRPSLCACLDHSKYDNPTHIDGAELIDERCRELNQKIEALNRASDELNHRLKEQIELKIEQNSK